jgi:hypothetical protein
MTSTSFPSIADMVGIGLVLTILFNRTLFLAIALNTSVILTQSSPQHLQGHQTRCSSLLHSQRIQMIKSQNRFVNSLTSLLYTTHK